MAASSVTKPALVDAQRMHRAHPATFEVPSAADLAALRPGDLVQVCNRRDRFWVRLTEVAERGGGLVGVVRDRLVSKQTYGPGDRIRLHTRNVYNTHRPPPRKPLLARLLGLLRRGAPPPPTPRADTPRPRPVLAGVKRRARRPRNAP